MDDPKIINAPHGYKWARSCNPWCREPYNDIDGTGGTMYKYGAWHLYVDKEIK